MSGVLRVLTRIAVLIIIFALATYTALTIQTYIGDSPVFDQTLGPESPLVIGGYGLYLNLTTIITNAVLIIIFYLVLAKGKLRTGLVRYPLGIITVYAILSAALFLVIIAKPAQTCTPLPTNLVSRTIFMASIVIGLVTSLIYALKKRRRVGSDWKPLLFTLYASIVVGSLIIDTTAALTLWSIHWLIPRACVSSVTIGYYGPIDGLVTAPLLGLLAGCIATIATSIITNKQ